MAYEYDNEFYGYTADDDADTFASDSRMTKKMRKELAELNKADKNFFQLKRAKPGQYGSYEMVPVFGSGDVGTSIRDAITGIRNYAHKVGSVYEDLYFKARICTGDMGQDSPTFFFDSPEQYEKHMLTNVNRDTKVKWHQKNLIARQELGGDAEPKNKMTLLSSGQIATIVK
jgi:hypothetical protein